MRIKTRTELEDLGAGKARLWVVVSVDGQEHRYVFLSGPSADVRDYQDGKLTFDEVSNRMKTTRRELPTQREIPRADVRSKQTIRGSRLY